MTAIEIVRDELLLVSRPRMARMLRMTAVIALVVMFSMAKRVPEAAVSAYIIFFIAQRDAATTVGVGIGAILGLTVALAQVFLFFLLSLGEPAIRVPLMLALAFGGMYLMRATPAGAVGLLLGFLPFYVLTFADWVPSPEALVRALLWTWVFLAYPIALLVLVDLALGTRPAEIYKAGIAERLAAAAADLGPDRDTRTRARIERYVRLGAGDLVPYVARSGPDRGAPLRAALLRQTELLCFLVRALPDDVRRASAAQPALRRASFACESARHVLLGRTSAIQPQFDLLAVERRGVSALPPAARAIVLPLVTCVQTVVLSAHEVAGTASAAPSPLLYLPKSPPPADRREGVRFALKATLAAAIAYFIYTGLDWYSVHTATITCFFVAQASVGATVHKLTLRLVGAIIGATLGMLAVAFVLPGFDSIGGLTVLVAAATLLSAWVATGSERIAYAGFQIALAFYLTVLQGFGPTTKLSIGRDRVIGIVIGNVLMSVIFTSVWPVRSEPAQRRALSRTARALASILRTPGDDRAGLDLAEADFYAQITKAREYEAIVWFERARGERGARLAAAQGLFVPIHAIARTPLPASASPAARAALATSNASVADWLDAFATTIASGAAAPPLPSPDPAVVALEPVAANEIETAETRAHVRQHLAWLELLRAQCGDLAKRRPA